MNGLVPALVAVLLAEVGPRGAALALGSGRAMIVFVVAAMIGASAVAGGMIAPRLAPHAEGLLIAVALGFAGWAQVARVARPATRRAVLLLFWRGGTALLVFALATRFSPASVGAGAALGLVAAVLLTPVVPGGAIVHLRRACAATLFVAAAILAVFALRLV